MGQLIETDWTQPPSVVDYIYSCLVDMPRHYYLTPNRQIAFMLIRGMGIIQINKDFRGMDDEVVADWMHYFRQRVITNGEGIE